jgi:hypothetical protein
LPAFAHGCAKPGPGAFAGLDGAVHVAVPDRGGLGAGPVERADRGAQGAAVFGPAAGRHQAAVAATGPLLLGPDALDEALGAGRPLTEEAGVAGEDRRLSLARVAGTPLARQPPLEKAEQDAGVAVRG